MGGGELCPFHCEESSHVEPTKALSPEEQKIAARTQKARKFFGFLRTIWHELLDADFQQTLA